MALPVKRERRRVNALAKDGVFLRLFQPLQ